MRRTPAVPANSDGPDISARAIAALGSGDGQYLTRMGQVWVGDAAGVGDHVVLAAVTVEPLRDGPERVAGNHRVRPRSGRRRRRRRRRRGGVGGGGGGPFLRGGRAPPRG